MFAAFVNASLVQARRVDMHENFTLAAADDDSNVYVLPNSKKSTFSKVTMVSIKTLVEDCVFLWMCCLTVWT